MGRVTSKPSRIQLFILRKQGVGVGKDLFYWKTDSTGEEHISEAKVNTSHCIRIDQDLK